MNRMGTFCREMPANHGDSLRTIPIIPILTVGAFVIVCALFSGEPLVFFGGAMFLVFAIGILIGFVGALGSERKPLAKMLSVTFRAWDDGPTAEDRIVRDHFVQDLRQQLSTLRQQLEDGSYDIGARGRAVVCHSADEQRVEFLSPFDSKSIAALGGLLRGIEFLEAKLADGNTEGISNDTRLFFRNAVAILRS